MRRKVRLLLCDDHALFRAGMKAVLRDHPALVVVGEAEDGQAALIEVERLRPDVVLMDIAMPRMDGFEATRRITLAHKEVKVLILSMYVEEQLIARCLDVGASGYVLKDVPVSQLAQAIRAVARGEQFLSAAAEDKVIDGRGRRIARARTRYDLLTDREREVLKLLADGLSVKEVAIRLGRSMKTAEVHKYNLMRKLRVHDRSELVKYAIAHRLVQLPIFEDLVEPAQSREKRPKYQNPPK